MQLWRTSRMRYFLALSAVTFFLASCSQEQATVSPDADLAARAEVVKAERDAVLKRKGSLQPIEAKWKLDETSSSFTGYYDQETLRLIEEEMTMGQFGTASSVYVFSEKGRLLAYDEAKQTNIGVNTGTPRTEKSELSLLFTEGGELLQGSRLVDGQQAPLTGMEAHGTRMHARELELMVQANRKDKQ